MLQVNPYIIQLIKATLNDMSLGLKNTVHVSFLSLHFSSFSFLSEKIKIKHPSPMFQFFYKVYILERDVQKLFQKITERMRFLKPLIIHSGI